jgi:hypothetical protein
MKSNIDYNFLLSNEKEKKSHLSFDQNITKIKGKYIPERKIKRKKERGNKTLPLMIETNFRLFISWMRNDDIRDKFEVAPIQEKLVQHHLWWFGHIQRRPHEASVRSGILSRPENTRRGRGRPKLTWEEAIKRNLKEWNIPKEIVLDRSAWKIAIHVPEPWFMS